MYVSLVSLNENPEEDQPNFKDLVWVTYNKIKQIQQDLQKIKCDLDIELGYIGFIRKRSPPTVELETICQAPKLKRQRVQSSINEDIEDQCSISGGCSELEL